MLDKIWCRELVEQKGLSDGIMGASALSVCMFDNEADYSHGCLMWSCFLD